MLCLILRCQEALFIYRTWRIEQMVLVFQPFSPVLVLFYWILVMRLLHCVVLECLWNSWCTTEKYRLESVLLYKGDLNPPTSIVPVTVLVNVCHNDLIPMERENKLLILIILCCCFLFILVKLVLSSLKRIIILLMLFTQCLLPHLQKCSYLSCLTRCKIINFNKTVCN